MFVFWTHPHRPFEDHSCDSRDVSPSLGGVKVSGPSVLTLERGTVRGQGFESCEFNQSVVTDRGPTLHGLSVFSTDGEPNDGLTETKPQKKESGFVCRKTERRGNVLATTRRTSPPPPGWKTCSNLYHLTNGHSGVSGDRRGLSDTRDYVGTVKGHHSRYRYGCRHPNSSSGVEVRTQTREYDPTGDPTLV